jgi:uncharacterized protein YybS (DUF2232 family)
MNSAGYGMIGAVVKGSLLTIALFLIYSTVPFLGAFAGIFVPLPCVYYFLKYSRVTGYAIVLLMFLFLFLLDTSSVLQYLILCVTCSLFLPDFLVRGKGSIRALFYTVGLNAVLVACLATLAIVLFGVDLDGHMRKTINDAMSQVGEAYRQSGLSGQELQVLEDGLRVTEKFIVRIYPSFLLIFLGILVGSNIIMLQRMSSLLGKDISFDTFSRYRNPDFLVWLLIVAGFTLLADGTVLANIALNVLVVLYCLYFVQGVAVSIWFAKKLKISRVLQVIFYALLALQPLLTVLVAIIGLSDLWIDYRAPKKIENL